MHQFARSIGFSEYKRNKDFREIIKKVIRFADSKTYVSGHDDIIYAEFRKEFAPGMGIAVCGEYTEENEFEYEYYFPYFVSDELSSAEEITVERHGDKDSFSGICEEYKVGVSLIFYVQNRMDHLRNQMRGSAGSIPTSVNMSALSTHGMIVLPLSKNAEQERKNKKNNLVRTKLIAQAKAGDERAIESLTLEDMDTFSSVSRRILKQDVFTLVDTYFMPNGVECDHYSVMGEIIDVQSLVNKVTKETVYIIGINCNDLCLKVCINEKDLWGVPEVKRRFRGDIWLQGHINYLDV